jgi:hypothetical protein
MIMSAVHEAATPPPGTAIARVGEARWVSFHAFCPADRDAVLMQVVQPVVAELWAEGITDRFFFIRYPEGGEHVRLRLRIAAELDAAPAADRALALLRASCTEFRRTRPGAAAERPVERPVERIEVIPAIFELEIDRYGGPRRFPCALAFFALSSMDALRFVAHGGREPRARQLIEILVRLTRQAIGTARTVAELHLLADYVAEWRPRMAPILARADQMFERSGPELTRQIREVFATAATAAAMAPPGTPEAHVVDARVLAAALDGLEGEPRRRVLGSQMHMTANRLGLNHPEESYLSGILCRCLDALGDELADLMAAAHAPVTLPAGAPAASALDARVTEGMHALFDPVGHASGAAREGEP